MKSIEEIIKEAKNLKKDYWGRTFLAPLARIIEDYTASPEIFHGAGFRLVDLDDCCGILVKNPATGEDEQIATISETEMESLSAPIPTWLTLEWFRVCGKTHMIKIYTVLKDEDGSIAARKERRYKEWREKEKERENRPLVIPFHGEKDWW